MGRRQEGIDWNGVIFAVAMVALMFVLNACATVDHPVAVPSPRPIPNFCEVQVAYRPPVGELQHVAKAPYTVDFLLKLNQYGQQVCGWQEKQK
ncbi:hypothetical protein EVC24_083 [Rhizobium phage RHph_I4]|nr:hypothetical protein EVC24_083 [Rhizobium phage RHph_I4]